MRTKREANIKMCLISSKGNGRRLAWAIWHGSNWINVMIVYFVSVAFTQPKVPPKIFRHPVIGPPTALFAHLQTPSIGRPLAYPFSISSHPAQPLSSMVFIRFRFIPQSHPFRIFDSFLKDCFGYLAKKYFFFLLRSYLMAVLVRWRCFCLCARVLATAAAAAACVLGCVCLPAEPKASPGPLLLPFSFTRKKKERQSKKKTLILSSRFKKFCWEILGEKFLRFMCCMSFGYIDGRWWNRRWGPRATGQPGLYELNGNLLSEISVGMSDGFSFILLVAIFFTSSFFFYLASPKSIGETKVAFRSIRKSYRNVFIRILISGR